MPTDKARTARAAIRETPPPDVFVVPLSQHTGAAAIPVVAPGARVDKGALVGQPGGFISAAVHAPASGEVIAIERRPLPTGRAGDCVVIRNDRQERRRADTETDLSTLDADAIRERVRAAGVVGMGGGAFPTNVKLTPPGARVETLIVNGAECEPYLTGDYRLMLECPEKIVRGADLARRAAGARQVVFAVEDDKRDAAASLERAASALGDARVVTLDVRYPQGGERTLIKSIVNREVPSGRIPADVGAIVLNVATCSAIYDACAFERPLIERVVTVSGPAAANAGNYRVRIGTLYADLLKEVGFSRPPRRVLVGGPMMGVAQSGLDVPVTKGTTGIILLDEVLDDRWRACIRCGKCIRACPARIMPADLSVFLEAGRIDAAADMDLADCIECGCCAYLCPSKRPIVHWIKHAKAEISARRAGEPSSEGTAAK